MTFVLRKTEAGPLDGTPEKRMFWSIISDYDLKTGICELVDNALDLWCTSGGKKSLTIDVGLSVDRQLISIVDNAGGVKQQDLRVLLSPGGSKNDPYAQLIGIFGVGGKRAGIALGEQVQIQTRYAQGRTLEIDITKEWLESPDWELPYYEVPDIPAGTTRIDISHLRKGFSQQDVEELRIHLGETYARFLNEKCQITLNGSSVEPRLFDKWAYPPDYLPQHVSFKLELTKGKSVNVDITAGLIRDRDPEGENYGVYFYCNRRLIVKELRSREVGYFVTSEAGVPHPDASLCRVIVDLAGPAQLMPWNSSKTGINSGHAAFQQARPVVIQLTKHFSSLSRRLKSDWDRSVLRHTSGRAENSNPDDVSVKNPVVLPGLPRVNKPRVEHLKSRNKSQMHNQPWTLGLVEAMGAVDIISQQRLETKNRIALILLDSNFEIALKEFIVHRPDLFSPGEFNDKKIQEIFQRRFLVVQAVSKKADIPKVLLEKVSHYYSLRNKLVHERATADVTDSDVKNYRSTIERILAILFGLRFPA